MNEPIFTGQGKALDEPQSAEPIEKQLREQGQYIPSNELRHAVDVALLLGQPLLLTGEPGTGKTTLGQALANELFSSRFLEMQIKSSSGREDLLYRIDELARFRDSQPGRKLKSLIEYFELRPFGEAICRACGPDSHLLHSSGRPWESGDPALTNIFGAEIGERVPTVQDLFPNVGDWSEPERWVVLIDEIDKAPRDTANDLLEEFDRMEFAIPELDLRIKPDDDAARPVVVVTSNSEKSLPDAFLRRCAFHHIGFPSENELRKIIASRVGDLQMSELQLELFVELFGQLRSSLQRKPGTAELLNWLKLLDREESVALSSTRQDLLPFVQKSISAIVKQAADVDLAEAAVIGWSRQT